MASECEHGRRARMFFVFCHDADDGDGDGDGDGHGDGDDDDDGDDDRGTAYDNTAQSETPYRERQP